MLTILIGKSGSGKNALLDKMIKSMDCIPVVSSTTRSKRPNEHDGIDYNFLSTEDFESKIQKGLIFEYRTYFKNESPIYYGSEKITLDKNKDYVKILDVEGACKYISAYGRQNCFVVKIEVPDEIRYERAFKREFLNRKINNSIDCEEYENDTRCFESEWNNRLHDDNERFSEEKTEPIVNFKLKNTDSIEKAFELLTDALNAYEYEMQEHIDTAHLHNKFEYPLLYVESLNNSGNAHMFVNNKSNKITNNVTHSHVEGLESLEVF